MYLYMLLFIICIQCVRVLFRISFWDTEKERIVILTTMAIIIVKYDFIAMKKKEFKRIPLGEVDTMVIGLLIYPPLSVVP